MAVVGEEVEMEDVDEDDEEAVLKSILGDSEEDAEEEEEEEEDDCRSAGLDEDDEEAYLGFLERKREEGAVEPDEEPSSASAGQEEEEEAAPLEEDVGTSTEKAKGGRKRKNKGEMEGLYAESQRLLRESRGAAFAAQPVVPKPISSVLEKIRARRRQLEQGAAAGSSSSWFTASQQEGKKAVPAERDVFSSDDGREPSKDADREVSDSVGAGPQQVARSIEESLERVGGVDNTQGLEPGSVLAGQASSSTPCTPDEQAGSASHGSVPCTAEQDKPDSPDILSYSQLSSESDRRESPVDVGHKDLPGRNSERSSEVDTEEEEEEEEGEKRKPSKTGKVREEKVPSEYIIARAMIDDEAEDEDDDGKGDSDEDVDENEGDLQDLVARTAEEKPSDKRKREKLHQEWLEERDQADTDDILHRLKNGWRRNEAKERAAGFLDEDIDREDSIGAARRLRASDRSRDRNDEDSMAEKPSENMEQEAVLAVEEDDEEEAEEQVPQRGLLEDWQEEGDFLIADNEVSREVLGLINRANLPQQNSKSNPGLPAPNGVKKPSPLKPSFLNRATSANGKPGKKAGPRVPSFIFGAKQAKGGTTSLGAGEDHEVHDKENNAPQVAQRTPTPPGRTSFFKSPTSSIDVWSTPSKPAEGPQLHDLLKIQTASLDRSLRENASNSNTGGLMSGGVFSRVKSFKSRRGSRRL